MTPTLVALAAGVGSRYGGLKQLEPVGPNGETLLEYSVFDALRSGFGRVVLVVRPETESLFRDRFDQAMARRARISYVHQTLDLLPDRFCLPADRRKPWGTGQAVLAAEAEIEGPFAVINTDDFYGAESFAALGRFFRSAGTAPIPSLAMIGFEIGSTLSDSGPVSRALCELDAEGRLERIVEILEMWKRGGGGFYLDSQGRETEVSGERLVSMNIWGLIPGVFPELRLRFQDFLERRGAEAESEFLLPEVIQSLVREGRMQVDVLHQAGHCYGITYPEDRERVAELLAGLTSKGEYPERLWDSGESVSRVTA